MSKQRKRVCLGAFAGAHGVKGDALVKTFTETPENVVSYGPVETEDGARRFTLTFIREAKPGFAIVRAAEITDREDAEALKGKRFYVGRAALPDLNNDEFYLDDLVGLSVFDEAGAPAGRVAAVHNFGAGDLIELSEIPGANGTRMIPFIREAVPLVDLVEHRLTVSRAAIEDTNTPTTDGETGETVGDDVETTALRSAKKTHDGEPTK